MKLANRIGAAVLATAMVGTLLTGCGGGSASTTASTGDGTAAASSTESSGDGDNTYTMFMRSTYVDTNGDKEFIVDYQTEEATPAGEKRWSFLSDRFTVCKPVDNEAFFKWNAPLIAEATGRLFTDENLGTSYVLKFTDDQSKEVTNLLASVYDAQMSGIAQFIDGTRELTPDNWAAFQQEMNDLGLSRIEEIQLAAYQAMYGA